MWALTGFIILGIVVTALIEINERIKAKKAKEQEANGEKREAKDCAPKKAGDEACSSCELISVCEKKI